MVDDEDTYNVSGSDSEPDWDSALTVITNLEDLEVTFFNALH